MLIRTVCSSFLAFTSLVSYGHEIGLKLPPGATQEDINLHRFCRWKGTAGAIAASTCVASVEAAGQKQLVSQCFDQYINFKVDPRTRKYIHEASRNSNVWHRTYAKTDNKLPYHRYDYTESLRDLAGVTLGRRFVDYLLKPGSKASRELNQSDLDLAFAQGYKIGYQQPDLADIKPDTYCEKGKPTCQTVDRSVKNEYPHSNPPPVKAPDDAIREDGKLIKIRKGPQDQDPIEACIMKSVAQRLKSEKPIKFAPWGSDMSHEQKKSSNQYLLKLGICDASYWGASYCSTYNERIDNFGSTSSL